MTMAAMTKATRIHALVFPLKTLVHRLITSEGSSGDDSDEDQQGDAVSDSLFIDPLSQPHNKSRTCRQAENDGDIIENIRRLHRLVSHATRIPMA